MGSDQRFAACLKQDERDAETAGGKERVGGAACAIGKSANSWNRALLWLKRCIVQVWRWNYWSSFWFEPQKAIDKNQSPRQGKFSAGMHLFFPRGLCPCCRNWEFPPEHVPDLVAGASGVGTEKQLAKLLKTNFTPERLASWLKSEEGKSVVKTNEPRFKNTLKKPHGSRCSGVLIGDYGLFGRRTNCQHIGLDPSIVSRKVFCLSCPVMHLYGLGGNTGGHKFGQSLLGMPFDFV